MKHIMHAELTHHAYYINVMSMKYMHLERLSEEDEASLLHVVNAIEAKNKLKALMEEVK